MDTLINLGVAIVGLGIVIFSAEQIVKGAVGTAASFGVSTFLISVIFIGFDPDNLSVGITAALEGSPGIATGSIIGAAMVAIAFAFGVSALFAPMRFAPIPKQILAMPVVAVLLLGGLGIDGQLSRMDGGILLGAYIVVLVWLMWLSKQGKSVEPGGEGAEALEKTKGLSRWKAVGILAAALVGIVIGTELLITRTQDLIATFGLSGTFVGMTILAFLVSVEELAREVPAAMKGRPEISFGNVLGSALAMFLFNAGVIALVSPLPITPEVRWFYFPFALGTVVVVTLFLLSGRVPRWGGVVLALLYVGFVVGSYLVGGSVPEASAASHAAPGASTVPPSFSVNSSVSHH